MSQHSQRTQDGPTRASVATAALLVAVSSVLTGYVTSGPGWDDQKVVATVLGVTLTGMLLIHMLGLSAERAVAQDRMAREADLATQREQRERAEDDRCQRMVAERVRHEARVDDELRDWRRKTERQRLEVSADLPEPTEEPYHNPLLGPIEHDPVVYPGPSPAAVARWAAAGANQPDDFDAAQIVPPDYPRGPAEYMPSAAAQASVPVPLPPRPTAPDGYVDPGPYSSWVPPQAAAPYVPVSPGRLDPGYIDCDGTCGDRGCPAFVDLQDRAARDWPTETIRRVDDGATQRIDRVRDEDDRSAATEVISRVR